MAETPAPRSFLEHLGEMIDAFQSRYGLRAMKVGTPLLSTFEAASQMDVRASGDIFGLLAARSIDNAEGDALLRIGADERVAIQQETAARGTVTISDSGFTRKLTKVFQGKPAPVAGSVLLYVADASTFPASGLVYVGRGTDNYEGPLPYSSKTNNTSYWTLTLSSPSLRFHNLNEPVILAQGGDRAVPSGTVVKTPQGNAADAVRFSTVYSATIPDGDTQVLNVEVVCQVPGIIGNVTDNSVRVFESSPFANATVTNPLPFTSALPAQKAKAYREAIKSARQTRQAGTVLALTRAAVGVISLEENRRVTSASMVNKTNKPSVLYVDDGTGYEQVDQGVAEDVLTDSALGGELYFQVSARPPVSKAFVGCTIDSPFSLSSGDKLAFRVGGVVTEHTFDGTEFKSISNATSFESVASINGNPNLGWSSRTIDSGARMVVFAREDVNEDVENVPATSSDANEHFGFPSGRTDTMRLYLNDQLLTKDGELAQLTGSPFGVWGAISGSQTLTMAVDKTPAATYTFTDADFVSSGTGYNTVGQNSVEAWVKVMNDKIPGVRLEPFLGSLVMSSNSGRTSRASLDVTGGTLTTAKLIPVGSAQGKDNDYSLDRNVGQVTLENKLDVGDSLTAGSAWTRAFVQSAKLAPFTLATDATMWISIDGAAALVSTGANTSATLTFTVSSIRRWGFRMRITAGAGVFSQVAVGDTMLVWDPSAPAELRYLPWKIVGVDPSGTWVEFEKTAMPFLSQAPAWVSTGSGKVMVCGGFAGKANTLPTSLCASYDPATKVWTRLTSMNLPRGLHTATLVAGGKVFVAGGLVNSAGTPTSVGELFDPAANAGLGSWTQYDSSPTLGPVYLHCATLLSNGKVFVVGGRNASNVDQTATATFDPATLTWAAGGSLSTARSSFAMCRLTDNTVIAAGGEAGAVLSSGERAVATGASWSAAGTMQSTRCVLSAVAIAGNKAMFTGGSTTASASPTPSAHVDQYDGTAPGWTTLTSMNIARCFHPTVLTTNGHVVVGFGLAASNRAESYTGGVWTTKTAPSGSFPRLRCGAAETDANKVLFFGGIDVLATGTSEGSVEQLDEPGNAWTAPTSLAGVVVPSTSTGFNFIRHDGTLDKLVVSSGSNYTADSVADALMLPANLDSSYDGAGAYQYKTNFVRLTTNTFDKNEGSVAVVATDTSAQSLGFAVSDAVRNISSHLASVESANPDSGTPDFMASMVLGSSPSSVVLARQGDSGTEPYASNSLLIGTTSETETAQVRYGSNRGFVSPEALRTWDGSAENITLRDQNAEWVPASRAYLAAPFSIGPEDAMTVVMDLDEETKRFSPLMYRKLKTVGTTYAKQSDFQDNGVSPSVKLGETFGISYSFDDFAVYMKARGKSHPADATRRVLWRYYQFGASGNQARVRYALPASADQPMKVVSDDRSDGFVNVNILLPSGAAKTGTTIRAQTKVGTAIVSIGADLLANVVFALGLAVTSATRTTNVTTLTLGLPSGVTNHGIPNGSTIYLSSTDVNFASGPYVLTGVAATTISYSDVNPNAGPDSNIGTVTYDTLESTMASASPAVVVGDLFRLASTASSADLRLVSKTIRIAASGPQFVKGVMEGITGSPSTTLSWNPVVDPAAWSIFTGLGTTATAAAAAANADQSSPVTGTVIGTGAGVITQSSYEEAGASPSYVSLTDGLNYVYSTLNPPNASVDYSLMFKEDVSSSLTTNSDWANEDVRIAPQHSKQVATWLQTLAVSGLSTAGTAQTSSAGRKVQLSSNRLGGEGTVQVQGGTAVRVVSHVEGSAVTVSGGYMAADIPKADVAGLLGGTYVSLENTVPLPKNVFDASTKLNSWAPDGTMTFDSGGTNVWDYVTAASTDVWVIVEKHGRFVSISDIGLASALNLAGVSEGDMVYMRAAGTPSGIPALLQSNTGVFRVVRVSQPGLDGHGGSFWVENEAITEQVAANADFSFIRYNSVMPGDTISVSTSKWGSSNQGDWLVRMVGGLVFPFIDKFSVVVDVTNRTPGSLGSVSALGADAALVQVTEGLPSKLLKKVLSVSPSPSSSTLASVKFSSSAGVAGVSEAAGTLLKAQDKLGFALDVAQGEDGYKHTVGLIGEVNRVIYGDPGDPATYPGVACADAQVNVEPHLVKRVSVAILVRTSSGVSKASISDRVKSVVASTINSTPGGQSVPIIGPDGYVTAAGKVSGVVTVVPVSPPASSTSDMIRVQPSERAKVLDLDDVQVSFISG